MLCTDSNSEPETTGAITLQKLLKIFISLFMFANQTFTDTTFFEAPIFASHSGITATCIAVLSAVSACQHHFL